jgi:hypothetical protein
MLDITICERLCGVEGELVALDAKTLRHFFDPASGRAAIHMVSA